MTTTNRFLAAPAAMLMIALSATASRASEPLSGEFQLNETTAGNQLGVRADADAAGNFVAAWHDGTRQDRAGDVIARLFDVDGNPLSPELPVSSAPGHEERLSLSVNAGGEFILSWEDWADEPDLDVFARRYDAAGNPLGPKFLVHPPSAGVQHFATVALADDGSSVVVWQDDARDCDGTGIFGQRFDPAGVPVGADFRVGEQCDGDQRFPEVAMDADGNFAVAWEAFDQPEDGDCQGSFVRFFNADGTARSGDLLANQVTTACQWEPRIAMNSSGRTVVAWTTEHDGEQAIWNNVAARLFDGFGNALTDEFMVNVTGADDGAPSIWGDQQLRPQIAVADDGRFLAAWRDNANDEADNDGSWGVYGRAFWASGLGTCEDHRVNETIVNEQFLGGVGMSADGSRHVVVWTDHGGNDGDGSGIFARRYGDLLPALPLPMSCFAANCVKVQLGSGMGDGKISAKGSLSLGRCPADDPEGAVFPSVDLDSMVRVLIDGTPVFEAPLGAFENRRGQLHQFRGEAGGLQIDFDRASWKFVDRRSAVSAVGVDPTDGLDFEIRIGDQVGVEHLAVDWKPARALAQACRHGPDQLDCP